jgi:hypothetical protein
MDKSLKVGDYTIVRRGPLLLLLHPALKEPVELSEHLLVQLFKRVTREALTL